MVAGDGNPEDAPSAHVRLHPQPRDDGEEGDWGRGQPARGYVPYYYVAYQ